MAEIEPASDNANQEDGGHYENDSTVYYRAASFATEKDALRCYRLVERAIYGSEAEVSVFRFLLNGKSHVAVIGPAAPPAGLEAYLQTRLKEGESTALPQDVLRVLIARRQRALAQPGTTWAEGHYRPGLDT